MRLHAATLAFAIAASASSDAFGQAPVDSMRPSASPHSHITTESARVLPRWTPAAAMLTTYGQNVRPSAREPGELVLDRRTTSHLLVALGLFDWTELSLDLPFVVHQQGVGQDDVALQPNSLGDLRIGAKGTVLRTPRRGFGLGLRFDVMTPTGRARDLGGTGRVAFSPGVLLEQRMARGITAALDLGYVWRRDMNIGGQIYGDVLTYRTAARVPLDRQYRFSTVGELDGAIALVRGSGHPVTLRAGLRAQLRSGVILGLFSGGSPVAVLGRPDVHVMLRIGYAPPGRMGTERAFDGSPRPSALQIAARHDARTAGQRKEKLVAAPVSDPDRDKVLAASDLCPHVAEDRDGFEDQDGCPELDNDRDGVRDPVDLCPLAPELINGYLDADGCPDRRLADGGETYDSFDPTQVIPRIAFAAGKADLGPDAQKEIAELAELMRLNPWIERVEIGVYVQAGKDPKADRALAQARVASLRNALAKAGIEPWRIDTAPPKSIPQGTKERVRVAVSGTSDGLRPLAPTEDTMTRLIAEALEKQEKAPAHSVAAQGPAPVKSH